jgi:hypothetical protein
MTAEQSESGVKRRGCVVSLMTVILGVGAAGFVINERIENSRLRAELKKSDIRYVLSLLDRTFQYENDALQMEAVLKGRVTEISDPGARDEMIRLIDVESSIRTNHKDVLWLLVDFAGPELRCELLLKLFEDDHKTTSHIHTPKEFAERFDVLATDPKNLELLRKGFDRIMDQVWAAPSSSRDQERYRKLLKIHALVSNLGRPLYFFSETNKNKIELELERIFNINPQSMAAEKAAATLSGEAEYLTKLLSIIRNEE